MNDETKARRIEISMEQKDKPNMLKIWGLSANESADARELALSWLKVLLGKLPESEAVLLVLSLRVLCDRCGKYAELPEAAGKIPDGWVESADECGSVSHFCPECSSRNGDEPLVGAASLSQEGHLSFAVRGITVRECRKCHCLTVGGPTLCSRCAIE